VHAQRSRTFQLTYPSQGRLHTVRFRQARVLMGRAGDCDVMLAAPDVSRKHAAIQRDEQGWTIADLGSRHGTFVNGRRTASRRLEDGDQITLGLGTDPSSILRFHVPPPPEEGGILFDDRATKSNIHLTINVEDFARAIDRPGESGSAAGLDGPVARQAKPPGPDTLLDAIAGPTPLDRPRVPIIGLFNQVGEVLLTSDDLEEMLARVVDLALENLPAERGFICLCDEATEAITPRVARVKGVARGESINISRSIAREAIRARQALMVSDALTDRRFAQSQSIRFEGIRAAMCAPLYHAGRVEGLVYVDSLGCDRFTAADLELLTALGVLTAVGIVQARLRDDVTRERAIRARLARYSSPHVVEQIVAGAGDLEDEMVAQEREVTVLSLRAIGE